MGGRPLLAASAAFAAGAFLGIIGTQVQGAHVALAALACAAALALAAAVASARGVHARGIALSLCPLLALAAAVGAARGAIAQRPPPDPALFAFLDDAAAAKGGREPLLAEAEVLSAEPSRGGARLLVRIDRREARPGAQLETPPGPGALLAQLTGPRSLHRGDVVRALVQLHRPARALNPGARDERTELALRGVGLVGTLLEADLHLVRRGPRFFRALDELREGFARRCAEVCTTPQRAALVAALGVGDRSGITPALDDELAESGLVHLLSSAGLHLAAMALLARFLARRLLLRTRFSHRAAGLSALAALPAALGEVLLIGASWPALRAGAGALVGLAAPAFARRADGLTSLALAAAACALFDPAATHELALQLSLLGVFGLIALARPLRELVPVPLPPLGTRNRLRIGGEKLLELCCATAAATLCTAPLLAAAFHRVSLVSVAANALGLAPGIAAVPLATLAVPLDRISQPLALPLFFCADALAGFVLWAAHAFAQVPAAAVRLAAPGPLVTVSWFAFVALLAGFPALGRGASQQRARPRVRLLRAAIPLAVLASVGCAHALAPRLSTTLTATFLAVGQGDAALVQLPGGRTMLIDAGGDLRGLPDPDAPGGGARDPGARDLLPALAELGVSRIDVAVLTHPHPDHAGGLLTLLRAVPVGELWITGEPGPGRIGDRIAEVARRRGVLVRTPAPGAVALGRTRVEVLHPDPAWNPRRSTNDNSIVLRLVHGGVALLFAGDIEALAEAELAQGGAPLEARLLKAPHHGSPTSSTDAFLRRVRPDAVVYSVGEGNRFGFPNATVVERTRALGATQIFRTDEGAITAVSDGATLSLTQLRPPD